MTAIPRNGRPTLGWWALALLFASGALLAAEVPQGEVAVRWEGDAVVVEARVVLDVHPARAWEVLSGYEKYPSFLSDLHTSKVVYRSEDLITVHQEGVLRVLVFRLPVSAVLTVHEEPPTRITARAVSGSFRSLTGRYDLMPAPGGLRFTYVGHMVPAFRVPSFIGLWAVRRAAERHFNEMIAEMVRSQLGCGGARC